MVITEWIISGSFLAIVGLAIKTYRDNDEKITRVYKRLDEVKQKQDDTFTRKDVCNLLHKQIDAKLTDIAVDIKVLLKSKEVR
jgi:hypothetical protein